MFEEKKSWHRFGEWLHGHDSIWFMSSYSVRLNKNELVLIICGQHTVSGKLLFFPIWLIICQRPHMTHILIYSKSF